MKPPLARKLWLALPAFLLCLADQVVTLLGQPKEYWAGDYGQAREGAPHGLWLLTGHPAWYMTAAAFYLLLIVVVIVWLPRFPARIASAGFVIGHTWGTSFWMFTFFPAKGYWISVALFVVSGFLLVLAFDWSEEQ